MAFLPGYPSQHLSQKIVVAVDFGTTFSALAWGQTNRHNELNLIERWPASVIHRNMKKSERKVPTILGQRSPEAWGYQVKEREPQYQWFKLLLDPDWRNDSSSLVQKYPAPIVQDFFDRSQVDDLVVKYLTALKAHSEQTLAEKFPLAGSLLNRVSREYIITIPAVWTDAARSRTRSCAERAGMGTGESLHVITEPEAAALYQLVHHVPDQDLKVHDTFVLCDAGGGTVDLISYTITKLGSDPEFKEATTGSGGLCGSTFLNRVFEKFLTDHFASHPDWSQDVLESAMQHFEREKKEWPSEPEGDLVIPIAPVGNSHWIVNGRLKMSSADVAQLIFDPVVDEVIKLVQSQIRETQKKTRVQAVLLVGGFGECDYLRRRLQAAVGDDTLVIPGHNSRIAIVQGALMRGLSEASDTVPRIRVPRKARKHYGTKAWATFNSDEHDHARSVPDAFNAGRRIEIMSWFINKGADVEELEPIPYTFYKEKLVEKERPMSLDVIVYSCEDLENKGAPDYYEEGVAEDFILHADLKDVPVEDFKRQRGADGRDYYHMEFQIEVTYYSAATKYVLIFAGKRYESIQPEYV